MAGLSACGAGSPSEAAEPEAESPAVAEAESPAAATGDEEGSETFWVLARPSYSMDDQNLLTLHRVDESASGSFENERSVTGLPEGDYGMVRVRVSVEPGRSTASTMRPDTFQVLEVLERSEDVGPGAAVVPGSSIEGVGLHWPEAFRTANAPTLRHTSESIALSVDDAKVISIQTDSGSATYRIGSPVDELIALLPGCQDPVRNRGGMSVECAGVRVSQGGPVAGHNITIAVFSVSE